MIIVYPSYHVRHRPPYEITNGDLDSHADVPERIESIKAALADLGGVRLISPQRFALSWIERVHDHEYVSYIASAGRVAGSEYTYPSVFPYQFGQHTSHDIGGRGQYSFDTYTPVSCTTYEAARAAAMAALTAASHVRRGERIAYALCRPPGHHALCSRMGGYCYFNNAAIAAEYLTSRGTVAVLDIDVHHGNGTQSIFYSRSDVLTVSIHADPDYLFPYFSGRANEHGEGRGKDYNFNLPLPLQTEDSSYHEALGVALRRITTFAPTYLVVSVGYDAHREDPIGRFCLTTDYYGRIARSIAALHLPTVLIQEGGYNTATVGIISLCFVKGFLSI